MENYYASLELCIQQALSDIYDYGKETSPRGRGSKEILGYHYTLSNPRDRIFGFRTRNLNPFYLVGNLLWVLRQSNKLDFIKYYNDKGVNFSHDGEILPAAYGKRIFDTDGINQWENVIKELKLDPDSRRALINIHMAQHDWRGYLDTSCTSDFQMFIRDNKLHMINHMRSQSAAFVQPYDVFLMTMLQEIMARELDVELGNFQHFCGSLHYFLDEQKMVDNILKANDYSNQMNEMPKGSNMPYIKKLLQFEYILRINTERLEKAEPEFWNEKLKMFDLPKYWRHIGEVLVAKSVHHINGRDDLYLKYVSKLENNPFQKLMLQFN